MPYPFHYLHGSVCWLPRDLLGTPLVLVWNPFGVCLEPLRRAIWDPSGEASGTPPWTLSGGGLETPTGMVPNQMGFRGVSRPPPCPLPNRCGACNQTPPDPHQTEIRTPLQTHREAAPNPPPDPPLS
jgi:hypothetical protein